MAMCLELSRYRRLDRKAEERAEQDRSERKPVEELERVRFSLPLRLHLRAASARQDLNLQSQAYEACVRTRSSTPLHLVIRKSDNSRIIFKKGHAGFRARSDLGVPCILDYVEWGRQIKLWAQRLAEFCFLLFELGI